MRGALGPSGISGYLKRIIPAYAGSTLRRDRQAFYRGDHPRVCGEHEKERTLKQYDMGSSPRMRGAPILVSPPFVVPGIIPAYAGSTCTFDLVSIFYEDHPRVCGEHVPS